MANVFTRLGDWVNERAPNMMPAYRKHMTEYYAPKNFNLWYYFGSFVLLVLVFLFVFGFFFSLFFLLGVVFAFVIVGYIHMFRGLMYGSFKKPRELVWLRGMLIFLALMAEAFLGYVLPWGNMSFWSAKVIISLFGAVP